MEEMHEFGLSYGTVLKMNRLDGERHLEEANNSDVVGVDELSCSSYRLKHLGSWS